MGFFAKIFNRSRNKKKFEEMKKRLDEEIHIDVGIPVDATPYPDGTSVVLVGTVNEFGSGTVPERSFLRTTLDENAEKYTKLGEKVARAAVDGKTTLRRGAGIIGAVMQGDIQETITKISTPPNAPVTIARKGSDNPLIDTGHMRASITFEVREADKDGS